MKNILLILFLVLATTGCNTYKRAQREIYSGNFDQALDGMLKKYARKSIKEKDIARWADLFNDAYTKANLENLDHIQRSQFLPENSDKYRGIYQNYIALQSRYDRLKPFLPIQVNQTIIPIKHENFYTQLEHAKHKLADALYIEGEYLMKNGDKMDARMAYTKYAEIAELIPSYPLVQERLQTAYEKGLTHILIRIHNDSRSILPRNLHNDLVYMEVNSPQYFWQKFHQHAGTTPIDYTVELNFTEIAVTPELVDRKSTIVKKTWIDSSQYRKDERGKVIRDSAGIAIKKYEAKNVVCRLFEIFQKKSAILQSEFIVLDAQQRIVSRVSPVNSQFDFTNISYHIEGNESALDDRQAKKIKLSRFIPFPNDEQMIYDCGQDLKTRFNQFLATTVSAF